MKKTEGDLMDSSIYSYYYSPNYTGKMVTPVDTRALRKFVGATTAAAEELQSKILHCKIAGYLPRK